MTTPRGARRIRVAGTLCATALVVACVQAPQAPPTSPTPPLPSAQAVARAAQQAMARTGAQALAVAVVEAGRVHSVQAFGVRNRQGEPLTPDTVVYGASLTKPVVAWAVAGWAADTGFDLDTPLEALLPKPLPDYGAPRGYADLAPLAGDDRWRRLTPRILLSHRSGFANFGFLEPDGRLRLHFDPGSRYAYSGDGYILLQFVLEQGLGVDLEALVQERVFDRFDMPRTGLRWRPDFAANLAGGWDAAGRPVPHDARSRVRAAGSMDTTAEDFARFAAGVMRDAPTETALREELTRALGAIDTATQFPTLQAPLPPPQRRADLATGLGVVLFEGPQGRGFFKGGHNDSTGNTWVCLLGPRRCVVLLGPDVRAEAAFPELVAAILGETGTPWAWEYGPLLAATTATAAPRPASGP